jgi:hypothetical protein
MNANFNPFNTHTEAGGSGDTGRIISPGRVDCFVTVTVGLLNAVFCPGFLAFGFELVVDDDGWFNVVSSDCDFEDDDDDDEDDDASGFTTPCIIERAVDRPRTTFTGNAVP